MPKDDQKELFVVVDEHDKILGHRSRYDCHHDKKLIHRAVGVVILNDKGEVLLQMRSRTKDTDPGKYAISASGHVSKGETNYQTAQRELFEEIGIHTKLTFKKKYLMRMENETEMEILFVGYHNGPFKIDKDEVDNVRFFKRNEITNILDQISSVAIESLKQINIL